MRKKRYNYCSEEKVIILKRQHWGIHAHHQAANGVIPPEQTAARTIE